MASKLLYSLILISYIIFSQHYFQDAHQRLWSAYSYHTLDKIDAFIFIIGWFMIIFFSNFKELLSIIILSIVLYFIFYGIQYHNYISKLFHQWPEWNFLQLQRGKNTSFYLDSNANKILYLEIKDTKYFGGKCDCSPFILVLYCSHSINCDGITVYARFGFIPKNFNNAIIHKKTPERVVYFYDVVDIFKTWNQVYKSDGRMLHVPGQTCYQSGRYYFFIKNNGNITEYIQVETHFTGYRYPYTNYCENTDIILIFYFILLLLGGLLRLICHYTFKLILKIVRGLKIKNS